MDAKVMDPPCGHVNMMIKLNAVDKDMKIALSAKTFEVEKGL
jgi:hypothetical protein